MKSQTGKSYKSIKINHIFEFVNKSFVSVNLKVSDKEYILLENWGYMNDQVWREYNDTFIMDYPDTFDNGIIIDHGHANEELLIQVMKKVS